MNAKRLAACLFSSTLFLFVAACGPEGDDLTAPADSGDATAVASPTLESTSSDIIGGTTDNGDPAVVLIYNNTGFLCSGAVIAPRVVLTAGHCSVSQQNCSGSQCTALPASGYQVAGGVDPFNNASWLASVSAVHPHPNLVLTNTSITHDMAILILSSDAPVTPLAWQKTNDASKYAPNTSFKAVGYGLSNAPSGPDTSGTKRTVGLKIVQPYSDGFEYGSASKNTCEGDSGGPAIENIGGVDTVIGTVSYGDQDCSQYGYDMRTDVNASFISTYDPDSSGTPGGDTRKRHAICSVASLDTSSLGGIPLLGFAAAFAGVIAARRRRLA